MMYEMNDRLLDTAINESETTKCTSRHGIIRTMERALGFSLVDRVQGGANGGSARLTAKGELFLEIFARYEQSVADYASEIFDDYFGELEERKDAVGSN